MTTNTHIAAQCRDQVEILGQIGRHPDRRYLMSILLQAAQALEAAPALDAQGEAVCETGFPGRRIHKWLRRVPQGTLLYEFAPPPPAVGKPLSDEDIQELLKVGNPDERDVQMIRLGESEALRRLGIVTKETGT